MADIGFKVGKKSVKLEGDKAALDIIVSSTYPNLKCWMRPMPRHYGTFIAHVRNLVSGGATTNILTIPHGYKFKPAFFSVWQSIQNANPATLKNGIGNFAPITANFSITARMDATNFYLYYTDFGGSSTSVVYDITFRYYLFGDEFGEGQFSNV